MLLGYKDRAELAGSEYTAFSSVLEGIVIVEKTPEPVEVVAAAAASTAMEI